MDYETLRPLKTGSMSQEQKVTLLRIQRVCSYFSSSWFWENIYFKRRKGSARFLKVIESKSQKAGWCGRLQEMSALQVIVQILASLRCEGTVWFSVDKCQLDKISLFSKSDAVDLDPYVSRTKTWQKTSLVLFSFVCGKIRLLCSHLPNFCSMYGKVLAYSMLPKDNIYWPPLRVHGKKTVSKNPPMAVHFVFYRCICP